MKASLMLAPETVTAMQDAARMTQMSEGDTVNRAIQFWALVQLVRSNGGAVYVRETPDGDLHEVRYADDS